MLPRPYQQRLVDKAEAALKQHGNTLACAATGAGKTIMLAMLAKRIGGKQLILQHRQELVQQNLSKFRKVNPSASCGLWTADSKSFRADTTFAMVQSLTGHVDKMPKLDLIIADEAHHCAAPTWKRILDAAREKNPSVLLAGFTATPSRSDRMSLRSAFSNVCDQVSIGELVRLGFLVPPRAFVISVGDTQEELSKLKSTSDFGEQVEVEQILNTQAVNSEIIRHWKERAKGRPTIIFCATIKHAEDVTAAFNSAGIKTACLHGKMGDGERKGVLTMLAKGLIDVIVNVMVLTEGFDFPPLSCVILLRKCSDKSPLIQMAGRGLRPVHPNEYPGIVKKDCLILDFGTSLLTHGDLYADVDLGGSKEIEAKEEREKLCPTEYQDCIGENGLQRYRFPDTEGKKGCGAFVPARTKECPFCGFLFQPLDKEEEPGITRVELTEMDILNGSPFRYVDLFGTERVLMASGFEAWAGVFSQDGETWFALGKQKTAPLQTVMVGGRLQAMSAADDFLRMYETETGARKSKRWLDDPASEKQIELLNSRFGYNLQTDVMGNCELNKYAAACHANFHFHQYAIEQAIGL